MILFINLSHHFEDPISRYNNIVGYIFNIWFHSGWGDRIHVIILITLGKKWDQKNSAVQQEMARVNTDILESAN